MLCAMHEFLFQLAAPAAEQPHAHAAGQRAQGLRVRFGVSGSSHPCGRRGRSPQVDLVARSAGHHGGHLREQHLEAARPQGHAAHHPLRELALGDAAGQLVGRAAQGLGQVEQRVPPWRQAFPSASASVVSIAMPFAWRCAWKMAVFTGRQLLSISTSAALPMSKRGTPASSHSTLASRRPTWQPSASGWPSAPLPCFSSRRRLSSAACVSSRARTPRPGRAP